MLFGEFTHSLDDKNRLSIPAKWRGRFAEGAVITRGLDGCLFVYSHDEWQQFADKLAALPLSNKTSRAFSRLMLSGASDDTLDRQGRISVPPHLRSYAELKKHVTIAGVGTRLELWDEDRWQEYRQMTESDSEHIAESMADLGI